MNPMMMILFVVAMKSFGGGGGWQIAGVIVCGMLFLVLYLLIFQESILYVTSVSGENDTPKSKGLTYEDVMLKTSDGVKLHAWFIPASDKWAIRVSEITVVLRKEKGKGCGMLFKQEDAASGLGRATLIVISVDAAGIVGQWNASNPSQQVSPGDLVKEVNGVRGDPGALLRMMELEPEVRISFEHVYEAQRPTMLFLHENAGSISMRVPIFSKIIDELGVNIFALDYRGYGRSEGSPSEAGLVEDALCAWRWLEEAAAAGRVNGRELFVFGRSLGGAVAVALAAELERRHEPCLPRGCILENTFTSIAGLLDTLYPFLAFEVIKRRFLRLQWRTLERIGNVRAPLLFLSGTKDEVIPASHMQSLHDGAKQARTRKKVNFAQGTHNDTWEKGGAVYWQEQAKFIEHCCSDGFTSAKDDVIEVW